MANTRWTRFRRRVRYWWSHRRRERWLSEEIGFHLDAMVEDLVARGVPEREAWAQARKKFGDMTRTVEDARATWIAQWMSDLLQDLRHAARGMRREIGFTGFVLLIAGLGIGVSSTVFSVVNAVLLRPLPFRDPSALVWISNDGQNNEEWTTQVGHFVDARATTTSFVDLAGWTGFYHVGDTELTGAGEPERLTSVPVTQNFFSFLGVEPALGRTFTPEEGRGRFSSPPAVILSHGFWTRRFAADSTLVGQTLTLNNAPVVVIGVLPAAFDFTSVFAPGTSVDVFIPWPLTDETNRQGNTMKVLGRLKPGVSVPQAQAELTTLAKQIESQHRDRNWFRPRVTSLETRVSGSFRPALVVLAGAVGFVMLIVCANLSNLQLARLGTRQKEMALRVALGAGRLRLLRQLLTESIALACGGAVLGLGLAVAGTREVAHLNAVSLPLLTAVGIDGRAIAFTLVAAVLTGVLFGVLPALSVRTVTVSDELKEGTRGTTRGGRAWVRSSLVVGEVALALTLLVGTGLLSRSFLRVLDVNLGFQPARASALRVDPSFRFKSFADENAYIDDVLARTRALSGLVAAGFTDALPFAGDRSWGVAAQGHVYPSGNTQAFIRIVTDGYFEAAGIPLREGRSFTDRDRATSEPVVMVNETLARTLWPGQAAVGQKVTQGGGRRVIGVVADVRHEALETAGGSEMYLPMRQTSDYAQMDLVVRTALPEDELTEEVRAALRPIDPNLPVHAFQPLQELVDRAVSPRRFLVVLLAGFAGFALLLASLGIYAVISQSVNQRTQEIGIRMALGASATDVQRRILLGTLGLAGLGLVLGLVISRLLTVALGSLLFGVTPGDPGTFMAMAALLTAVAALAGYVPAWRASRIDPMVTLRSN
jgi:predicted permease